MAQRLTANQVLDRLQTRCKGPGRLLLTEVYNGTGLAGNRRCDALALGLWPSRGYEIEGFEIKVARSDWLKELADPAKSADWIDYCDRWWVVAGHGDVVRPDELPRGWGLLLPRGKGLGVKVQGPLREPPPLDRCMLAAIIMRTRERGDEAIRAAFLRGVAEGRKRAQSDAERNASIDSRAFDELKAGVARFEEASGVTISEFPWRAGDIGRAVKVVRDLQELRAARRLAGDLRERADVLRGITTRILDAAEVIEGIGSPLDNVGREEQAT